jgi:hypothetical protein
MFFVAACPRGQFSWGSSCQGDREVYRHGLEEATEFSVVLDLERGWVFFLANGCEIPGSGFEIVALDNGRSCKTHVRDSVHREGCQGGYRFIASVPPGGGSVTLVGDLRGPGVES